MAVWILTAVGALSPARATRQSMGNAASAIAAGEHELPLSDSSRESLKTFRLGRERFSYQMEPMNLKEAVTQYGGTRTSIAIGDLVLNEETTSKGWGIVLGKVQRLREGFAYIRQTHIFFRDGSERRLSRLTEFKVLACEFEQAISDRIVKHAPHFEKIAREARTWAKELGEAT